MRLGLSNRRQVRSKRRKFSGKLKLLIAIFTIPLFIIGYFLIFHKVLVIKSINYEMIGADCVNQDNLQNLVDIKGQSLFFIDNESINKKIRDKFPCVNRVNLIKKFPETLTVQIDGREAIVQLGIIKDAESTSSANLTQLLSSIGATSSAEESSHSAKVQVFKEQVSNEWFLVDEEGQVFAKASQDQNLPKLYFFGGVLRVGDKLADGLVKHAIEVFQKLKSFNLEAKEGKIYSQAVLLIDAKPKIVFRLSADIDNQLGSLQLILEKAKMDNREIEIIDLRFEKPIIKYGKEKGVKK